MSEPTVSTIELEMKQLERDKLAEELRQIKASGTRQWITPTALASLVPLFAAFGIWFTNQMKEYNEGYRALGEREGIRAQKHELERQKVSLNSDIATLLSLKRDYAEQAKELRAGVEELRAKVELRQQQLDSAYLRALFASEEARYTLSLVEGMSPRLYPADIDRLKGALDVLPPAAADDMKWLLDSYALSSDMITASQETLKVFDEALNEGVSDWAWELEYRPDFSVKHRDVMVVQKSDGTARYYDINEQRFLTPEESRPD